MELHEGGAAFDRVPPFDRDAELAVLGAMLIDPAALAEALELLKAGMFYVEAHRRVFQAMDACRLRGAAVDVLTLADQLKSTNELEAVGGFDYLGQLVDAISTSVHLSYHAAIVREKAQLRRLVDVSTLAIRDVYDTGGRPAREIIAAAETRLLGLGEASASGYARAKDRILPVFEAIERRQDQPEQLPGIPTGIRALDLMLLGLHAGQLTVVAGRPSMGKTALAMGWALNAAIGEQVPTLVFSFEMPTDDLVERAIASEARVDLQAIRGGRALSQAEHERMAAAGGHLSMAPLFIDDGADTDVGSLQARVRRAKRAEGIKLVVIDYLQLMEAQGENRRQEIDTVTRRLKAMARSLNVAVVLLSQLSRAPETRSDKRPQMSDLRESGGIEQDADNVVMVYRPEYYLPPEKRVLLNGNAGLTELIIPKQRNGPTGSVQAWFRHTSVRFDGTQAGQEALL